jgi:RNA polymerase sigma-70 factor, ECF subfamily
MTMVEGARIGSGDGLSFDAFFRTEYRRLAALATVLSGDRDTGCDLAQEALIRSYEHWDKIARLERPGAWTRRVVVNLARDHARHRAVRRRRLPVLANQIDASGNVVDPSHDGEFWAAVATLPDRQRTAVALYYVGDRSISHVAQEMGIREGSVKTMLHQARNRLRQLLSEDQT